MDTGQYTNAKTKLDEVIAEHEAKYPNNEKRDFNFGEKIMMNHASRHLDAVIEQNDPSFVNMDGTIGHHSDIVKEALETIPKSDYTETM